MASYLAAARSLMQAAAFMQKNRFSFLLSPVALVLLMGVITTVFYYRFAIHDQIEQLPLILRFMEGDYLERDFFTNAGDNFGPRFYNTPFRFWYWLGS